LILILILTRGAILRSKGQGHWERNVKNRFPPLSSLVVDRFTSNQDQIDKRPNYTHRPIHFISRNASFLW